MSVPYNNQEQRDPKGKAAVTAVPALTPASSGGLGPTTFFLRTEKEMDRINQRGRKSSRGLESCTIEEQVPSPAIRRKESSFGVESLEDALASTFGSIEYVHSDLSLAAELDGTASSPSSNLKRKAGNPVHPKIVAAGRRIISSDHSDSVRSYSTDSRHGLRERRISNASSIPISQPFTPLRASPPLDSAIASTPRSASPKSFRLDGDESSVVDDESSDAVQSPWSEGRVDSEAQDTSINEDSASQLVMPSLAIPRRRPFTENGRRIGRLKALIVGGTATGRTSLIQNIFRTCTDVVHVDPPLPSNLGSQDFTEFHASTKPLPSWMAEMGSRSWSSRRKSFSEGSLDRNICLIDGPAIDRELGSYAIETYLEHTLRRAGSLQGLEDGEIVQLLGNDGNTLVNAIIWVIDADVLAEPERSPLTVAEKSLLQRLCQYTNVIPVIGRADLVPLTNLAECKECVRRMFTKAGCEAFPLIRPSRGAFAATGETTATEPFAVSSALGDDGETIDASILMSSQYMQPLVASDLETFSARLLQPDNVARIRYMSALKFSKWRAVALTSPAPGSVLTDSRPVSRGAADPHITTSTGSLVNDHSKVMIPYGTSSYFRSTSPSAHSGLSHDGGGELIPLSHDFADERTLSPGPYRRVRLAKWAQDLQRSLENERRRYKDMYADLPAEWTVEGGAKVRECSLITAHEQRMRTRGRLGGAVALIDPRDPLGILALSQAMGRRSWLAVRIAGGLGLIGAALLWAANHWYEMQELFGVTSPVIHASGIPPPAHKSAAWTSGAGWREFFGY